MKFTHTHLTLAAAFWLALGSTLASSGQNVAQAPWRGRPALASRGHLGLASAGYGALLASQIVQVNSKPDSSPSGTGDGPATKEQGQDALATAGVQQEPASRSGGPLQPVTAEHRGRLLVLTYGPKPGADGSASFTGPRGEPPRFAVYQGHRQIASGQFEYG